jgi:hypothetical protein
VACARNAAGECVNLAAPDRWGTHKVLEDLARLPAMACLSLHNVGMPALSYVYPYPAHGRADSPTDEDEVADVAIRGCRSVTELYSEALASLGLVNRVSELRLFIRHDPSLADVRGRVQVDPVRGGFEMGHLSVPTDFTLRTPQLRARMLLEAVHGLVSRLAVARGWDPTVLEGCRQHALDNGLEYRWISDPKASPNRRYRARAIFRLPPDGYGRVRLEVLRPEDGTVVGSSEEALAFCTSPGFRRAARSMRWHGNDTVSMVPYDFVPAIRGGRVTLRRAGEEWSGDVEEYMTVRPVPDGDSALRSLRVHVEGRGATAPEQRPRIGFIGGGPIETRRIARFHDAFTAEMSRFAAPAGQEWWQDAGVRMLEVEIVYGGDQARVRSRHGEHRLRVFVDRPDSSLPDGDPAPLARTVAEEVVAVVRRRTGLGPHLGFAPPG